MRSIYHRLKDIFKKHGNVIFFVGGFLFDSLTLMRIDSKLDLFLQVVYLLILLVLLTLQARKEHGLWKPPARLEKYWEYESEAVHFFYGGLLSAYVIFYFKSTTFSRSLFFLSLVIVLMFLNEMPQIRRVGATMRIGLYAFCLVSFLNYFLPVMIGNMSGLIFLMGWLLSVLLTGFLVHKIALYSPQPAESRKKLVWPPAAVLILVAVLYYLKLIPPVPLSMQYAGIFQNVDRQGDTFHLRYEKPPWYAIWRRDNRPFKARPGDKVFCFTRIFAPRNFTHQIYISWSQKNPQTGEWQKSDRIPLPIVGGRDEGFRGFAYKSNYTPGVWQVEVETQDGRILGGVNFRIEEDLSTEPKVWEETKM